MDEQDLCEPDAEWKLFHFLRKISFYFSFCLILPEFIIFIKKMIEDARYRRQRLKWLGDSITKLFANKTQLMKAFHSLI